MSFLWKTDVSFSEVVHRHDVSQHRDTQHINTQSVLKSVELSTHHIVDSTFCISFCFQNSILYLLPLFSSLSDYDSWFRCPHRVCYFRASLSVKRFVENRVPTVTTVHISRIEMFVCTDVCVLTLPECVQKPEWCVDSCDCSKCSCDPILIRQILGILREIISKP